MENANFKCPKTGESFFIEHYKSSVFEGEMIYTVNSIRLQHEGSFLIKIEEEISNPTILGSKIQRSIDAQKFITRKAKKHSSTDEQKSLKSNHMKREILSASKKI